MSSHAHPERSGSHKPSTAAAPVSREAALRMVMERRAAGRAQSVLRRALRVLLGLLLLIVALLILIPLPELGVPATLLALRLLAVEFEWAARGYAWVAWRWEQLRRWLRSRSPATRAALTLLLLAFVALIVWLLVFD